jgi:hypothetical protein
MQVLAVYVPNDSDHSLKNEKWDAEPARRQAMTKAYRITLQIPACVLVAATGLVERSVIGSGSSSARRTNCSTITPANIRSPSGTRTLRAD